jgi:rfaE bifunctional protein kinase chain/domain
MKELRIKHLLELVKDRSIGVIGDFCIDCYWLLSDGPTEYSIETNKQTFCVKNQKYSLGGAGNVVRNLVGIGVKNVFAFGVIGDDIFGREMVRQLEALNIDILSLLIQEKDWDTPTYSKPFVGFEEQERIDFGRFNQLSEVIENALINKLKEKIKNIDALIINQQLKNGIYSNNVIKEINKIILENEKKIFLIDSRNKNDLYFNAFCKINALEAARLCGEQKKISDTVSIEDLKRYAKTIFNKTKKTVFISRSEKGIILYDGDQYFEIPGILITGKIDAVGAGDTVTTMLASLLTTEATIEEAAAIANLAAGVVVQKLYTTGTAAPNEIIEMNRNAKYIL